MSLAPNARDHGLHESRPTHVIEGDCHGEQEPKRNQIHRPDARQTARCRRPAEGRSSAGGSLVLPVFEVKESAEKGQLATLICDALTTHTTIEEEIFYPAFIEATGDKATHHEAVVEHAGAKKLIDEIQGMSPSDDYFDAKVTVLSEMIKHHVKEEEQPGGMFAEAKRSGMDLRALGEELAARKDELQATVKAA